MLSHPFGGSVWNSIPVARDGPRLPHPCSPDGVRATMSAHPPAPCPATTAASRTRQKEEARGDRPRAFRRRRGTRRGGRGGARADRRRGHHVHLLPVRLGHRPDHGQGRPGERTGRRSRARASSSSTARRRTCSSTATATTSATAPRPWSWSASRSPTPSCRCPGTRRSRASGAPASATARSGGPGRRS